MTETGFPTAQIPPKTPGKNKKVLLIGLIVFFLLAGTVSVYGYTSWDWFKSARQVYLEAESENCQALLNSLDNAFTTVETDYKPFLEESVHTTQNITANISTGSSQLDPQTELILGILQRSKITLDCSQDPKTKQSTAKIDLSVNGASPLTLQTFQDNDKAGLALPTLNPKFLVANYKDEETIKQNLGIDYIPHRLTTSADVLNAVKTSKSELAPIYERYAKIYGNAIQKNQVKAVSGKIKEGDTQVNGKIYTVTFNDAQAKDLVNKLADQLSADNQLADLLYTKYKNIIDLYQTSGMEPEKIQTKDDLTKSIQDYAAELKTASDEIKSLTLVISIDKNKKIVERIISEAGTGNSLKITNWTSDKQTHYAVDFQDNDSGNDKTFNFACTTKQQDDKQHTGTMTLTIKETGPNPLDLSLDTDFTETKDTYNCSQTANFTLITKDTSEKNQFSGSISNREMIGNEGKSRTFNTEIKIKFDSPAAGLQGSVLNLNSNGKYEFGNPVTLPQLDSGNSLDLGKATRSDMDEYMMQLQQGLGSYLQREPSLMQIFLPVIANQMQIN